MLELGIDLLNLIYPVGSIYMSVNGVNPSTIFGGTWERWGNGRVPVGIDVNQTEFNTVEKTGGAKTHTLTVAQMPSHNHPQSLTGNDIPEGNAYYNWAVGAKTRNYGGGDLAQYTGGGQAHNNLQPYITCYMWKRTA